MTFYDFDETLSHPRPFPLDQLPKVLREYCTLKAKAIGCDPLMIITPSLSVVASAIGTARHIDLGDGWTEPSIIWTYIVAASGSQKTPAFEAAMLPVRRRAEQLAQEHRAALEKHKAAEASNEDAGPAPVLERVFVADTTLEALARVTARNAGLLYRRDELSGMLGSLGQYSGARDADLAKWLELHSGGSMTIDRVGLGEPILTPPTAISVCGTVQPSVLAKILSPEMRSRGMAARFLPAFPDKLPRGRRQRVGPALAVAEAAYVTAIDRLYSLRHGTTVGLPLSRPAEVLWEDEFEQRGVICADTFEDDEVAVRAKEEAHAARLALDVQCLRVAAGEKAIRDDEVDATSLEAGVAMAKWYADESIRIHSLVDQTEQDADARQLVQWVRRKGGLVRVAELAYSGPRRFRGTSASAREALNALVDRGLGQLVEERTGGRPAKAFRLLDGPEPEDDLDDYFRPARSGLEVEDKGSALTRLVPASGCGSESPSEVREADLADQSHPVEADPDGNGGRREADSLPHPVDADEPAEQGDVARPSHVWRLNEQQVAQGFFAPDPL